MPDRSSRQRHVGLAVAYELWQHWQSTGDTELFLGAPSEVLFEIARFLHESRHLRRGDRPLPHPAA